MRKQHAQLSSLAEAEGHDAATASQKVAEALRDQIAAGQLAPGVRLTEEVVAGHLNVSRNTVREALAMLAAESVAERKPNRGVFVMQPTPEMVVDLYRYRVLTECAAVVWAEKITRKQLIGLRRVVKDAEAASEADEWDVVSDCNQLFHAQIVDLAGSQWLNKSFRRALAVMRLCFQQVPQGAWENDYVNLNMKILKKLEENKRDAAAAELRNYLEHARNDVLRALEQAKN